MECLSPVTFKTAKQEQITVPCGYCVSCLDKKRGDWAFRLKHEVKDSKSAFFVTLTYADGNCEVDELGQEVLSKGNIQRFLKRLRKKQAQYVYHPPVIEKSLKYHPIRYYIAGEYGPETLRPHYHGIIFNMIPAVRNQIEEIWGEGFVTVSEVNDSRISYVTHYIFQSPTEYGTRVAPFHLMSKRPPLGISYVEKTKEWHKSGQKFYVQDNGVKQRMPRIYRDRIFSKFEKQKNNVKSRRYADEKWQAHKEKHEKLGNNPITTMSKQVAQKAVKLAEKQEKKKKL